MISFKQRGNFNNTDSFFRMVKSLKYRRLLEQFGKDGIVALSAATPIESGLTASSWSYEIQTTRTMLKLVWYNSLMAGDTPVAILIQYGHGTKNGGYVQGRDFINPAMRPIFDNIAITLWRGVIGA